MIILLIIGVLLIGYGLYAFTKAIFLLLKSLWVLKFANEKQVDEEFRMLHSGTPEHKAFEKQIDNLKI